MMNSNQNPQTQRPNYPDGGYVISNRYPPPLPQVPPSGMYSGGCPKCGGQLSMPDKDLLGRLKESKHTIFKQQFCEMCFADWEHLVRKTYREWVAGQQ